VEEKEYPVKTYLLTSLDALERYWWDMCEICVNTPLGGSSSLTGQEITIDVGLRYRLVLSILSSGYFILW
jgi:hypothetical protein